VVLFSSTSDHSFPLHSLSSSDQPTIASNDNSKHKQEEAKESAMTVKKSPRHSNNGDNSSGELEEDEGE
jgi:hypothetical protein